MIFGLLRSVLVMTSLLCCKRIGLVRVFAGMEMSSFVFIKESSSFDKPAHFRSHLLKDLSFQNCYLIFRL